MARFSVLMLLTAIAVGAYQYKENSKFQPEVDGPNNDITQQMSVKDKSANLDEMSAKKDINEEDDDKLNLSETLAGPENDDLLSGDEDYLDADDDDDEDDDEDDLDDKEPVDGELASRWDVVPKADNSYTAHVTKKRPIAVGKSLGKIRFIRIFRSIRHSRSRRSSRWFGRRRRSRSYRRSSRSYRRSSRRRSYRRRRRRPSHEHCQPCPPDCCHPDDEHDNCQPCPQDCCQSTPDLGPTGHLNPFSNDKF